MSSLTVPANISVADDCEQLRTAFKGWGTNEKLIISILAHRNAAQRKLIRDTYAESFNEDLLKELDRELTNDFEKLVQLWTLDPSERDAHLAKEATKRWTSSNFVLVEIACTRSPKQLVLVREAYHARFKKSLEEDVAHHTTGEHRKLLVPLVSSYRYGGEEVDLRLAKAESKILHEKISNKAYSDDEVIRILATRSKAQINATLNHYKDEYGDDILKQLEEGDEFVALLRATIKGLVYPQHYFVEVLRDAINRRGTEEHHLTRVIATRAEVDLKIIDEHYFVEVLQDAINRRGTEEHHLTRVIATRGEVNLKIIAEHCFVEVLRDAINRKGTEEHHLTRVIATRAEVDLKIIADEYQKRDSIPLGRAIAKDTRGDYESMLLALIGEEED